MPKIGHYYFYIRLVNKFCVFKKYLKKNNNFIVVNCSGLCDYDLSSEEDGEVSESNSKSVSGRCESTKSSVINVKNRKSEERDRKYRRDRRRSRNSSPRFVVLMTIKIIARHFFFE